MLKEHCRIVKTLIYLKCKTNEEVGKSKAFRFLTIKRCVDRFCLHGVFVKRNYTEKVRTSKENNWKFGLSPPDQSFSTGLLVLQSNSYVAQLPLARYEFSNNTRPRFLSTSFHMKEKKNGLPSSWQSGFLLIIIIILKVRGWASSKAVFILLTTLKNQIWILVEGTASLQPTQPRP